MDARGRKRPKIGDVVRIDTADGVALAQYIHHHPEFGALVRVLGPGPSAGEPSPDPEVVARLPTQFGTFFPLGSACHRGIATVIGPAHIPEDFREFPRFRQAMRLDPSDRAPCKWVIWDGNEEWIVPYLRDDQKQYPLRAIMNDTLLVQRTLQGWRPEHEV